MKHIFFVHSKITFLMSKKVIEYQRLPLDTCIFVFDRMATHSLDYGIRSIQLPFELFPKDYFRIRLDFWNARKSINALDVFINEQTGGEQFLFYVPKAQSNYFHLTITNNYCVGFYYIEEGYASYNKNGWFSKKKHLYLRDWFYGFIFEKRVPSVKHFYEINNQKYKGCYTLSPYSFEGFPNKYILELPFQIKEELNNYESILVFSCELEFGFIKSENFKFALEDLCKVFLEKKIKHLHFKFHPGQKQEVSINLILSVFNQFRDEIDFVEIEDNISLEEIAVSSLKSQFYIINSSIGLYATIAGRKVYSFINFVRKREPDFQKDLYVPPFYLNNLELL